LKIESYNEWSPLKSVIVGTATNANFSATDKLFQLQMSQAGWTETPPPAGPVAQNIIDETNKDLQILCETLDDHAIAVYRPEPVDFQLLDGQYAYCPRDNLLVVGNTVIEAPMSTRARQYEMICYRDVKRWAIRGKQARWIAAPHPELRYHENIRSQHLGDVFQLTNVEPIFDAANVARFGRNLLYLVSDSGNERGAEWLQTVLGSEYEVHTTNVYNSAHIDSTIVPIDENYVVLNASRVTEDSLPWFIQKMNKIWITDDMINPQGFTGYPYASKWIAINMLAIGDKKVICDINQPKIHEALKQNGFHVIPLELRHARTLGGGFHCVTLDLLREE
jgi:glycine amidinotransferase/scyllo-inosamine-4-phosphate amidinotransferase 1